MSKKIVDVAPLMEYYRNRLLEEGDNLALEDALERLRELKDDTDSLRPVGHWIESICLDDAFWVCSNCKFPSQASAAPEHYHYCRNCGAKMKQRKSDKMAKVPYSVLNKAELDLEKKFDYQFRFNHHGNQASVRVLPQKSYSELTPDEAIEAGKSLIEAGKAAKEFVYNGYFIDWGE